MNKFKTDVWRKKKILRQECATWPDTLTNVPYEKWPEGYRSMRVVPYAVMRSKTFLVQIFNERTGLVRMSINRTSINNQGEYLDGIVWDELQELKRQAGFSDCDAVEVFPPNKDLVNVANIRHLWIFTGPSPLEFIWRKQ